MAAPASITFNKGSQLQTHTKTRGPFSLTIFFFLVGKANYTNHHIRLFRARPTIVRIVPFHFIPCVPATHPTYPSTVLPLCVRARKPVTTCTYVTWSSHVSCTKYGWLLLTFSISGIIHHSLSLSLSL